MVEANTKQVDNPFLLGFVTFLFLISFTLIVSGVLNKKNDTQQPLKKLSETDDIKNTQNASLQEYFNVKPDVETTEYNSDPYLQTDPFRKVCDSKNIGNYPVFSFGTVCMR